MTLTFDLLTPNTIGTFYSIRAISIWSLKSLGETVLKLSSRNSFQLTRPCDLGLWPTDPSNERNLLLNKGNQHIKFEDRRWNGTQVIVWKRFSVYGPLWPWPFWPTDPNNKRNLLLNKGNQHMKFEVHRKTVLKLSSGNEKTDRPTDRPTDRQAHFVCGGIINIM